MTFTPRRLCRALIATFAAAGLLVWLAGLLLARYAEQAGPLGGMCLALAYLCAVWLVWLDGKPIMTRSGVPLHKGEQRGSYLATLLLMSLFGWVPLLVLGSML